MDGGVRVKCSVRQWKIKSSLKVKIFVWLVLNKMVLTFFDLLKRGWHGDEICVLCMDEKETVDHLFSGCAYTTTLLKDLLPNKLLFNNRPHMTEIWRTSCAKKGAQGDKELMITAATWWVLWLERNKRIFQDTMVRA